ncbi:hypothetical protein [Salicibibacter kimchii]|uniref:Uncharacterized protein n=1 Tax=Salicibibacter kimchii TaxID=2099786 RepID=A0A345C0L4_9BACI|nr:hypothetical protein [Salicibibacter kimchii]AXF56745.1 hypothetical protein DT065_12485 [Salicibibacter kimchii]
MDEHVPWSIIKNSLLFGMDVCNMLNVHYDDDVIKNAEGSLFKLSDKDEEIIIGNEADFYIFKCENIRFPAVKVS